MAAAGTTPAVPPIPTPTPLEQLQADNAKESGSIFDALADAPEELPLTALKEEGDSVIGAIVGDSEITTDYGEAVVLHLETPDGEMKYVPLYGARLSNWYSRTKPEYGDAVQIICVGMKDTQNGKNQYRDFTIKHVSARRHSAKASAGAGAGSNKPF